MTTLNFDTPKKVADAGSEKMNAASVTLDSPTLKDDPGALVNAMLDAGRGLSLIQGAQGLADSLKQGVQAAVRS